MSHSARPEAYSHGTRLCAIFAVLELTRRWLVLGYWIGAWTTSSCSTPFRFTRLTSCTASLSSLFTASLVATDGFFRRPRRAWQKKTRQTHEPECIPRKISQRLLLST